MCHLCKIQIIIKFHCALKSAFYYRFTEKTDFVLTYFSCILTNCCEPQIIFDLHQLYCNLTAVLFALFTSKCSPMSSTIVNSNIMHSSDCSQIKFIYSTVVSPVYRTQSEINVTNSMWFSSILPVFAKCTG